MNVIEVVIFRIKPDCVEEGLELAKKIPQEAARYGRILEHRTYRSVTDAALLCHHIVWESMADFEKASAQFAEFPSGPRMMECMEEGMTMHHFELMAQGTGVNIGDAQLA
ncbi:putative quinol monooxygenase [Marinimicrobium sp. ABcell2]|uniref:putative quinol monooxygenase n=1 Tax=Marinimicrobium sp. ABcell2 TaxID=3069751 RepID=UPI0027AEBDEA|nr:hypothetical protein [Marinimicrobium sp. ABcell2]MDQ2076901.1 hypothetical protein [Marinimicrobium sp. ABcell2]